MKKENIALIVILAIQLIVYIFMGVQKSYIHMDEAYSIGLTNYDKVEQSNGGKSMRFFEYLKKQEPSKENEEARKEYKINKKLRKVCL